jgi:hypothetical protein
MMVLLFLYDGDDDMVDEVWLWMVGVVVLMEVLWCGDVVVVYDDDDLWW